MTEAPSLTAAGPLVVLVPVLRRPHRVAPLLESLFAATPDARVLFLADPGDPSEVESIFEAGGLPVGHPDEETSPIVYAEPGGNYAEKINWGVGWTTEPLILFGADDLHFHPGWLEAAVAKLKPGIGVVCTLDLCNERNAKGDLATHPLVTREYAELGAVDGGGPLHEGYPHEYVDQEFTETAMHRNAYAFAPDSVVEHLHPQVGKAPMDDLYSQQGRRMRAGYRVYRARRHLWA